jgi:hypothetical protein
MRTAATSLSIMRRQARLPQAANFQESEAEVQGNDRQVGDGWISGTYATQRTLMVTHNPSLSTATSMRVSQGFDERQCVGL